MDNFIYMLIKIYAEKQSFEAELKQAEEEDKILKKAERSIYCLSDSLIRLKEYIRGNKFANQNDEILFFKEIKPSIYSKLIYFIKIFNIESKRPNGSDKSQKKYLLSELNKLELFFSENFEFYQYYRNNMTYLDDKYFVRGKPNVQRRIYKELSRVRFARKKIQ